uniref:Uncharacterized protein n=1 Tax=Triticum urartu TaxID=4572 RepID=A0A8R7QN26_TRIUA
MKWHRESKEFTVAPRRVASIILIMSDLGRQSTKSLAYSNKSRPSRHPFWPWKETPICRSDEYGPVINNKTLLYPSA